MRLEPETDRFYLARFYSEAVEAAGGLPVQIPLIPRPDFIKQVVADLDGLLLPGSNSDIDPQRYGREPHPQTTPPHPLRDAPPPARGRSDPAPPWSPSRSSLTHQGRQFNQGYGGALRTLRSWRDQGEPDGPS